MYLSRIIEDVEIAAQWLVQLIGESNAVANLFILESFYRNQDTWRDTVIDDYNFCKMSFKTFPVSFGKDYRYDIEMICVYAGEKIVEWRREYSRFEVGNNQPEFDFSCSVCDQLRVRGIEFHSGLYAKIIDNTHTTVI